MLSNQTCCFDMHRFEYITTFASECVFNTTVVYAAGCHGNRWMTFHICKNNMAIIYRRHILLPFLEMNSCLRYRIPISFVPNAPIDNITANNVISDWTVDRLLPEWMRIQFIDVYLCELEPMSWQCWKIRYPCSSSVAYINILCLAYTRAWCQYWYPCILRWYTNGIILVQIIAAFNPLEYSTFIQRSTECLLKPHCKGLIPYTIIRPYITTSNFGQSL